MTARQFEEAEAMRIAAVGDLHCRDETRAGVEKALEGVASSAEALLLAGDLTDLGLPEEADMLAEILSKLKLTKIAVLGNHDVESGQEHTVKAKLSAAGVHVLDGETYSDGELGVAGARGFCGGFEHAQLQRFGEPQLKQFVDHCLNEELKLENALFKLRTRVRIALLHYSPSRTTVEGEPLEIFPFLGATRLAGPIDQLRPMLAFHGHAHRGTMRGATRGGVPVYNVALPVLRRQDPPLGFLTLDL
jgi:Icc-related predicted phosphoesterase